MYQTLEVPSVRYVGGTKEELSINSVMLSIFLEDNDIKVNI